MQSATKKRKVDDESTTLGTMTRCLEQLEGEMQRKDKEIDELRVLLEQLKGKDMIIAELNARIEDMRRMVRDGLQRFCNDISPLVKNNR